MTEPKTPSQEPLKVEPAIDIDGAAPDPLAPLKSVQKKERLREKVRGRSRPRGGEPRVEQKRSPEEIARKIYQQFVTEVHPIVFRPETERPMANNPEQVEDIPEADLSYTAAARLVAESRLQFDYSVATKPVEGKDKRSWRPIKIIGETQTSEAHVAARVALRSLMIDRYQADRGRLAEIIQRNHAMNDKLPQADAVKKAVLRHEQRGRKGGASLEVSMNNWQTNLAKKRWEVMMDAVDWFGARVSQAEESIKTLTRGVDQPLSQKVDKLDTDPGLQADLSALNEDILMLEEVVTVDPECATPEDTKWVKDRLTGQLNRAKLALRKLREQIKTIKDIAVEKNGLNQIDFQRTLIAETFLTNLNVENRGKIGGKFIDFCQSNIKNLSVEEQLNFWSAINEMFDDIAERPQRPPRGTDTKMYDAAMIARLKVINEKISIYAPIPDGKGVVINHSPTDGTYNPEADDQMPSGVEQVVLKAKTDAKLLGELRQKMRKTFAMMGKDFRLAVRRELHGSANAEKIKRVEKLNKELSNAQRKAVENLKTKDSDFAAKLGNREAYKLKWSDKDDNSLLGKIRAQLFTELELGAPTNIKLSQLAELLNADEPGEAADVAELAQEAVNTQPVYDQIMSGNVQQSILSEMEIEEQPATAKKLKEGMQGYMRRLSTALQSGLVRDVMQQHFEQFVPAGGISEAVQLDQYFEWLKELVVDCERMKVGFGENWVTELGLVAVKDDKKEANKEKIQKSFERLEGYGHDFIAALELSNDTQAVGAIMNKIEAPIKEQLVKLNIPFDVAAGMLLYAIPRFEETEASVPLNTAARRLIVYLTLGNPSETGMELLQKRNLLGKDDKNPYKWDVLLGVLRSSQPDGAAI